MKELILKREAYCNYLEHYSYHFDEEELKELNDYLERTHVKKDENDKLPEITMEIVAAIYERDYDALPDDILETRRTFNTWNYDSETTLENIIRDYIDERVWNNLRETEFLEVYETKDKIETTSED